MNKATLIALLTTASALALPAMAKLPAPVLDDAAKAKAAEAAAKTAWTGKMDGYQLCKSMDKAAAHYQKTAASSGKAAKPPTATLPCADPGPFVYTPAGAPAPGVAAPAPAAAAPAAPTAPAKKS
jgi:hypothetical protein